MNKIALSIFAIALLSGCVKEVKPWEKETMAKDTMQRDGNNKLITKYKEHIYFSKEASKGGNGVAGGGCGCN